MSTNKYIWLGYEIKAIQDKIEIIVKQLKEYIQDKEIPLKDRWDIFNFGGYLLLPIHGCTISFKELERTGNDCYYDMFYIDRYSTTTFIKLIEYINENLKENEDDSPFIDIDLDALKEEMLASEHSGWIEDW